MPARSARALREIWSAGLLAGGILVAALVCASHLRLRADLTADGEFALAPATRSLLAGLEDHLAARLFFNRDIEGAEEILPARMAVLDLLEEMRAVSGGRMEVETVDPATDAAAAAEAEVLGIQPVPYAGRSRSSLSVAQLYQGLVLRYGGRDEVIPVIVPDQFEFAFAAALSGLMQPEPPRIGFVSGEPPAPPRMPGVAEIPDPPERIWSDLRRLAGSRARTQDVGLEPGSVLDGFDALFVLRPEGMPPEGVDALRRYVAGGGHLAVFLDFEAVTDPLSREPRRQGVDPGQALLDWFATLDLHPRPQLVFDDHGTPTNVPVVRSVGAGRRQSMIVQIPNGLWPLLEGDASLPRETLLGAVQPFLVMLWAHPVLSGPPREGLAREILLRSSPQAWLLPAETPLAASQENLEGLGRQALAAGPPRAWDLAVLTRGRFGEGGGPEGLLAVFGDADFLRNGVLRGENETFAANLVDWMVQDTSLIGMRSRGRTDRRLRDFYREHMEAAGAGAGSLDAEALRQLDREAAAHRRQMERRLAWANVGAPPLLVLLLGLAHWRFHRRRARRSAREQEAA